MSQPLSPYITLVFFLLIFVLCVWQSRRMAFGRQFVTAMLISLVSFQVLFFDQGYVGIPGAGSSDFQLILFAVALIFGFNAITHVLQSIFVEVIVNRRGIRLPIFMVSLNGWIVTFIATIIIVRNVLGIELTGLIVTSTIASAIIALSFQEFLSGLFAGVIMQMESPFSIGDWVEISGQEGTIEHLNWRTVALLTRNNNYVVFPNNDVAAEKIINYSRPMRQQAIDAHITAAFPNAPGRVKATLLKAIDGVEGILDEPKPVVFATGFGGSSMEYMLRYWIDDYAAKTQIQDEVYSRSWYALTRAGMGDPFGILDVNILSPEADARLEIEQKHAVNGFLRSLPILAELTDDQIDQLATASLSQSYTAGESLVRQGEEGDSLFIVRAGQVGVYAENESVHLHVKELATGDFFGEMSLLTGEPRNATVLAENEVDVIVIDKEHFSALLTANPEILALLLNALDRRRDDTETKLAAASEKDQKQLDERTNLMQRIANFLGVSL